MKKTRIVVFENVKQLCISSYLWISIICVTLLMLLGDVYVDMSNGEAYSIVSIIFVNEAEEIIEEGNVIFMDIILGDFKGYLWMFAPIILSLPFVGIMCTGNSSNNARYVLSRAGKIPYIIGKLLSSVIVGGIIMLMGFFIYIIIVYIVLYIVYTGQGNYESYIYDMYINSKVVGTFCKATGLVGTIILKLISVFMYGCVSTYLVLFFSIIIKNKYLIMTTSFVFNYLWSNSSVKLLGLIFNEIKDGTFLSGLYKNLVSQTNMGMLFLNSTKEIAVIVCFNIAILVILIRIEYLLMERRCDCGEI